MSSNYFEEKRYKGFVITGSPNAYWVQKESEHEAYISNAFSRHDFSDFNTIEDVKEYIDKYFVREG